MNDNGEIPSDDDDETIGSVNTPKSSLPAQTFCNLLSPSSYKKSISGLLKPNEVSPGFLKNNLNNTKFQ